MTDDQQSEQQLSPEDLIAAAAARLKGMNATNGLPDESVKAVLAAMMKEPKLKERIRMVVDRPIERYTKGKLAEKFPKFNPDPVLSAHDLALTTNFSSAVADGKITGETALHEIDTRITDLLKTGKLSPDRRVNRGNGPGHGRG